MCEGQSLTANGSKNRSDAIAQQQFKEHKVNNWDYTYHIGVWVLGFAVLGQHTGGNLVDLANKLEHWVIWEMSFSEGTLGHVARISLAENSMSVSRNNLASLQG